MILFGILSTPLPYVVLAAFYLFSLTSGMISSKDQETEKDITTYTVQTKTQKDISTDSDYLFHSENNADQVKTGIHSVVHEYFYCNQVFLIKYIRYLQSYRYLFSESSFSRPPPTEI